MYITLIFRKTTDYHGGSFEFAEKQKNLRKQLSNISLLQTKREPSANEAIKAKFENLRWTKIRCVEKYNGLLNIQKY